MKKILLMSIFLGTLTFANDINKGEGGEIYKRIYKMSDDRKVNEKASEQVQEILMNPVEDNSESLDSDNKNNIQETNNEKIIKHILAVKEGIQKLDTKELEKEWIINDMDALIEIVKKTK